MASLIGIWNLALTPLGADRVMDPLEDTESARKCSAVYESIRDELLEAHPWKFATDRIQLALTANTPLYEFTYEFQMPSDSLRVLRIEAPSESWRREGSKILANESPLYIVYIKQITDTTAFSSAFVATLASRMAFELSFSITNSSTFMERLWTVYEKKLKLAKATDAQEGTPYNIYSDRFIDARAGNVR